MGKRWGVGVVYAGVYAGVCAKYGVDARSGEYDLQSLLFRPPGHDMGRVGVPTNGGMLRHVCWFARIAHRGVAV